jgi:xylulokinase
LADVLNREVVSIVDHPGASYGAAVIAGVGTGVIIDWNYVVGALEAGEVISPTPSHVDLYDERYLQFHQLNESTTSLSHSLARSSQ